MESLYDMDGPFHVADTPPALVDCLEHKFFLESQAKPYIVD